MISDNIAFPYISLIVQTFRLQITDYKITLWFCHIDVLKFHEHNWNTFKKSIERVYMGALWCTSRNYFPWFAIPKLKKVVGYHF